MIDPSRRCWPGYPPLDLHRDGSVIEAIAGDEKQRSGVKFDSASLN